MLKTLQKRMKRAPLSEESMSSAPAFCGGVVGDEAGHDALHAAEADHEVLRKVAMHLEEIAVVDQPAR